MSLNTVPQCDRCRQRIEIRIVNFVWEQISGIDCPSKINCMINPNSHFSFSFRTFVLSDIIRRFCLKIPHVLWPNDGVWWTEHMGKGMLTSSQLLTTFILGNLIFCHTGSDFRALLLSLALYLFLVLSQDHCAFGLNWSSLFVFD